jgi:hypothetical protein
VQPARGLGVGANALAQQRDERDHRVAARLSGGLDPRDVGRADQTGQVRLRLRGRDAGGDQRVEPGGLDVHHRREQGRVREQVPGALVPGPEEVGHGFSVGDR